MPPPEPGSDRSNPELAMLRLSTGTRYSAQRHPAYSNAGLVLVGVAFVASVVAGCGKPASEGDEDTTTSTSRVQFVSPSDGDTVSQTFGIEMAVEGMTVEPAGEIRENSGHFHVIVDAPFVAAGEVIPTDDNHIHFGTGVSTAELSLAPGTHTLRLLFANGAHIAYDPAEFGQTISVTVE